MAVPAVLLLASSHGFIPAALTPPQPAPSVARYTAPSAVLARETRREVLVASAGLAAWAAIAPRVAVADDEASTVVEPPPPPPLSPTQTKSGLTYSVVKSGGKSSKPIAGDLIAIKFKCIVKGSGAVIDNILDSAEPYYYRVGSGQVLPAVDEAVKLMTAGDIYQLTVPPALGFGPQGRKASPGKGRVPGDAILDFTLELVAVPGKDDEILEQNGLID